MFFKRNLASCINTADPHPGKMTGHSIPDDGGVVKSVIALLCFLLDNFIKPYYKHYFYML